VVIPTYNRSKYLPMSVGSVMAQTAAPLEILVVDDGSTDDTEAVVSRLEGPIRYVSQKNLGPAAARNRGIQEARGELIALLDSDDVWKPDKLERQIAILDRNLEVGMVHTAATLIDENGEPTGETWGRRDYVGRIQPKLLVANGVNASSVLVRRRLLEAVGGYDERFTSLENWDLWIRLSGRCAFGYLDVPLIQYRVHAGNLIKNLERLRQNYELLLQKHQDEAEPRPEPAMRRMAYARFHQAFADALVQQRRFDQAQVEFVKSLFYQPMQPGVGWRLFRVTSALMWDRGARAMMG